MAAKAGLGLAALALIAACGSNHPSAAPAKPPSVTPSSSITSPSPSVRPSPTPSPGPVSSWEDGGGLDKIAAITTDITAIHDAGSDAAMVRAGCAELETSASAAQLYRPIPVAEAQQHWAAALAAFKVAAGECLAGIDENKPELLHKTSSDLDTGTTELAAATKSLRLG